MARHRASESTAVVRVLSSSDVGAALDALRPRIAPPQPATIAASSTKQLVLQALRVSEKPTSAVEVSAAIGISRATAQRYEAELATTVTSPSGCGTGLPDGPNKNSRQIISDEPVLCDDLVVAAR